MNNLPRPMKSCFLLTLACAVPALGQMMYNPPASGGGAPAAAPSSGRGFALCWRSAARISRTSLRRGG